MPRRCDQAIKDAHDRLAIVSALVQALQRGDKTLIGNNGFRRFVTGTGIEMAYGVSKIFKKHPNTGSNLVQWGVATAMKSKFVKLIVA